MSTVLIDVSSSLDIFEKGDDSGSLRERFLVDWWC